MPFTFDDTQLLAGLDRLIATAIPAQIDRGGRAAAEIMEEELKDTQAHGDITGATRASYTAGLDKDWAGKAAAGYAAAQSAIAAAEAGGYGLGGKAQSTDSGVEASPDTRIILLTAFTDYQDSLEIDNGGQKATLGPTLQKTASFATARIAAEGLE